MYTTYTTDAIIMRRLPVGEADADVMVYTEDFGLIRAKATGIRLEQSKLRYSLQALTRARISVVRGKRGWRITGAEKKDGMREVDARAAGARVCALLERLVRGPESDQRFFTLLCELFRSEIDMSVHELSLVAGMMYCLGYVDLEVGDEGDLYTEIGQLVTKDRSAILKKINQALHDSHL